MSVVHFTRAKGPNRPRNTDRSIIAALDVGSTKVCCMIAEIVKLKNRPGEIAKRGLKVLGFGHQGARGMRGGAVIDIVEAERSIRLAVDAAERMAQTTISEVIVSFSGGRPSSTSRSGQVRISGHEVSGADMQRAVENAMAGLDLKNRVLLHASPVQFHLDDAHGVQRPLGMFGEFLKVDVNAVSAEPGAMRNLGLAIERCHLDVSHYVIAPHAGARAVLSPDEMAIGTTYVEMGGATTSVAVYHEGKLIFAHVIPLGGQHITNDIARGLSTHLAHAERLKTLQGSALAGLSDERETIAVPLIGERGVDSVHSVPRSRLTGIIRPRLEEIFEMLRDRLETSPVAALAGQRVVLSGGASQLSGLRELATQTLGCQVRLGMPRALKGMPEVAQKPAFAAVTGLLDHALNPDVALHLPDRRQGRSLASNYLVQVGRWLKESF
jgi:cell division protein FtsA